MSYLIFKNIFFLFLVTNLLLGQKVYEESSDYWVQQIDTSYKKGLNYLADTQNEEGSWDNTSYGSEVGVVGLALLAFIARGDDPEFGTYRVQSKKALEYLLKKQDQETGLIGSTMYNHGFATLSLAEVYGRVMNPEVGPALQKATNLILNSQKNNPKGAWRYTPESTDADTTVSGAQLVALLAARNAGVRIPKESIEKGIAFLLTCQDENGGFGYTNPSGANLPRTSIGSLVLSLAKKTENQSFRNSIIFLEENAHLGDQAHKFYSLYYTSQAMFRTNSNLWNSWNAKNLKTLRNSQKEDGSWNGNYGPVFSTASALLSIAINYRYLPIYER